MSTNTPKDKPNVVLIVCHDLGDSLGTYGSPVSTPNVDALAAEGVTFQQHFVAGVLASPARGALFTGCYPHTNGLMGQMHRGWNLDVAKCPPLPLLLAETGYGTHLFGFQHEHIDTTALGYQRAHDLPSYHGEEVASAFVEWLGQGRGEDAPFLATLSPWEAHRIGLNPSTFERDGYQPADPDRVRVPPYLPDIPAVREDLAGFYGAVSFLDRMVGRIVSGLEKHGLSESTLLVLTADGGPSFMHAKGTLYDAGIKVALIVRWPGRLPAGRRVEAMTSQADLLPTLLAWIGLPVPPHVEGQSLADLASGVSDEGRGWVFCEMNHERRFSPARMVRSESYKYVRKAMRSSIYDGVIQELELCPSSFRQNAAVFDFYSALRVKEELYDLRSDPAELTNLAREPAYAEQLAAMRAAPDAHLDATGDYARGIDLDLGISEDAYERVRAYRQSRR